MIRCWLGRRDYEGVFAEMRMITETCGEDAPDELWVVEHDPVYTLGKSGKTEHLLNPGTGIPVVRSDRGGQITYHGPGQIVVYTLLNFGRLDTTVGDFVKAVGGAIVATLERCGVDGRYDESRPGVYAGGAKIASLGFRIRGDRVYHGIALNHDMDLSPFKAINPCGHPGLEMTTMKLENPDAPSRDDVAEILLDEIERALDPANLARNRKRNAEAKAREAHEVQEAGMAGEAGGSEGPGES